MFCVLLSTERDPTLRIKYSRKHPMFADDGHHHQHKKQKISVDAYTARSNELFERNLFTDITRHSEHGAQPAHRHSTHSSSSKHGHHGSQHDHHRSSSHDKHEQKKQVNDDFVVCTPGNGILSYMGCMLYRWFGKIAGQSTYSSLLGSELRTSHLNSLSFSSEVQTAEFLDFVLEAEYCDFFRFCPKRICWVPIQNFCKPCCLGLFDACK